MKYRQGDIVSISVSEEMVALARVVLKLRGGNILIAVYPDRVKPNDAAETDLAGGQPVFLVETMDVSIKDGTWPVVGNWKPAVEIAIPVYKVQVAPGNDFYLQHIDGNIGDRLTPEQAASLRTQKSFSPALVESALRALHGMEPWLPLFDEMRPS